MIVTPPSPVKSSGVMAVTVGGGAVGRRPGSASDRPLTLNPSPPSPSIPSPPSGGRGEGEGASLPPGEVRGSPSPRPPLKGGEKERTSLKGVENVGER